MELKGKKIFVTGAGGFIGSHLCNELINLGADVTAMLHYNSRSDWSNLEFLDKEKLNALNVVKGNIEDPSFMNSNIKGHDIVFHLAALIGIPYSYEAPLSYVKTNIQGTVNVLEASRNNNIDLVINTSTSETYGTAIYTPIDEKHPMQGQSPYSASKISADKLTESYYNSFALPVVTIRPFNTYGPRQTTRAVIPTIITQLLTRDTIVLGDLSPIRDFTFVDDTVRGFILAAQADSIEGEVINIGFGKATTIGDLVNAIMSITGMEKDIITDDARIRPKDSEVFELICNNQKANDLLNWQPTIQLNQGLERVIEFISENLDLFKSDKYSI